MGGAVTWLGHATVVVDLDGERIEGTSRWS